MSSYTVHLTAFCASGNFFRRLDEPTSTSHRRSCNDLWSDQFATVPINFLNRMSSMTSPSRPFLSSLLCCVIAFGQLPALLHVASCHGHAHCQRVGVEKDSTEVCSHGCHHQPDIHQTDSSVGGEKRHVVSNEESPAAPLHDSEHCAICHSLAKPVGLVWNFELPLVQECLSQLAPICVDRLLVEASIAIPQPRGPPSVA